MTAGGWSRHTSTAQRLEATDAIFEEPSVEKFTTQKVRSVLEKLGS